jgi:hypothetical protein
LVWQTNWIDVGCCRSVVADTAGAGDVLGFPASASRPAQPRALRMA